MSEKLWWCGSYELFVVSESPSKRLCLLRSINGQLLTFALQLPNLYPKNIFTSTSLFILLLFLFLFVLKWIFSCSVPTNPFNLRFCALNLLGLCILLLLSGTARDAEIATNNVRLFSYNSLRSATNNFHPSSRVGGGGFGVVYRGVLRDGTQVAIKCLSAESKQGTQEFLTEINMISNIRHPNLVELIGCCIEGSNRILVYEYLENNSIASVILGSKGKHVILDWPTRVSICMGTASGLAFLHEEAEPHIVHRDIKASNVLLDGSFLPKIGDFGLAKLFPDNVTHVSTRVAGTVGYLAPEYALLGQLTKKADVYSFGVLMLEIISGRSSSKAAFGEELLVLVEWTWKLKEEERLLEIVDPELTDYPEDEMMRFIKVALFCTQAASHQRPNMKLVVDMLSKDVILNEKVLTQPGVYKGRPTHHVEGSLQESSSSQGNKGKQSINPFVSSTSLGSQTVTQMLPR